jgi:hypothetical protein
MHERVIKNIKVQGKKLSKDVLTLVFARKVRVLGSPVSIYMVLLFCKGLEKDWFVELCTITLLVN